MLHPQSHYTLINHDDLNHEQLQLAGDVYSYPTETSTIFHAEPVVGVIPTTDLAMTKLSRIKETHCIKLLLPELIQYVRQLLLL